MLRTKVDCFCGLLSTTIKHKITELKIIPNTEKDQTFHCMLINFITCLRHYDSIIILCEKNYYEDALAIKRNLFEAVLNISAFEYNEINVIKWILYSGFRKDKKYSVDEMLIECKKYNINFKDIKDIFIIKSNTLKFKNTWLVNKLDMAEKVNLKKEYFRSYKYAHPFVHNSGEYHAAFIQYDIKNSTAYLALNPTQDELLGSLIILDASLLLLRALETIGTRIVILDVSRIRRIVNAVNKRLDAYVALP